MDYLFDAVQRAMMIGLLWIEKGDRHRLGDIRTLVVDSWLSMKCSMIIGTAGA